MTIEIRDLERFSEYQDCARLQIEVWGFSELDVVPPGHLVAMHHYGGVCLGAFENERMVGFVCGFTGWDRARVFHHSHMLAVVPGHRGQGVGEKLKWSQRDRVLAQGLDLINWTFDPLQAPNANLNVNRLGCIVRKYKVNVYGESWSPLHGGIPTDRFEAEWHLKDERVLEASKGVSPARADWEELPRANRTKELASGFLACESVETGLKGEGLLIEIPRTVTDLMAKDRDLALDWRHRTRQLFQEYFGRGYSLVAVHRLDGRVYYRLERS